MNIENVTRAKEPTALERYRHYSLGNYPEAPLTLVRGAGSYVWDESGRRFLDFTSGIAVNALGHAHPRLVRRIAAQAAELIHCSNLFRNPAQAELAERLVKLSGPGRVFFCNSGAEANEALLKLARLHGQQKAGREGEVYEVVCASNAFHGRTFGGMAATPQEKIQGGFRPMLEGFRFAELNDIKSFAAAISEHTAAVFLETIQGEGGIHVAETNFLRELRALCTERGVLLMLDEVQCGAGRTGRYFAFEHAGIVPDAIGMAKGLAGGFPIGAVWVAEAYAGLFTPGSHGTTFGGNPMACASALEVLDVIVDEDLLSQVSALSADWWRQLESLATRFPAQIGEVRGKGYLVALGLKIDPVPYVTMCRDEGILTVRAGANALRLLPPLTASAEELAESVAILERVFEKAES